MSYNFNSGIELTPILLPTIFTVPLYCIIIAACNHAVTARAHWRGWEIWRHLYITEVATICSSPKPARQRPDTFRPYSTPIGGLHMCSPWQSILQKCWLCPSRKISELITNKNSPLNNFYISSCPPCKRVFIKHVRRVNYQETMWKGAHETNSAIPAPTEHGWKITNGILDILWFEGQSLPFAHIADEAL